MFKKFILLIVFFLSATSTVFAQQTQNEPGLEDVCIMAGGKFTSTPNGDWACCWDNWGCAGCSNGICKVKCHTQRCRRANGQIRQASPGQRKTGVFHPFGIDTIVIPKKPNSQTKHPTAPRMNTN